MSRDLTVAVRDYAEIDRRIAEYQRAELSPHTVLGMAASLPPAARCPL